MPARASAAWWCSELNVSAALPPQTTKEMAAFFEADSKANADVIKAASIKLE
jgi:hypothetical protein